MREERSRKILSKRHWSRKNTFLAECLQGAFPESCAERKVMGSRSQQRHRKYSMPLAETSFDDLKRRI